MVAICILETTENAQAHPRHSNKQKPIAFMIDDNLVRSDCNYGRVEHLKHSRIDRNCSKTMVG